LLEGENESNEQTARKIETPFPAAGQRETKKIRAFPSGHGDGVATTR
jgi:hypothetical protein